MSYNPFDPPPVLQRFAALKELRDAGRVVEVLPGFFYLSHHEDIVEVSKAFGTFEQGGFSADEHVAEGDHVALGGTNPPRHTTVRKAMARIFTPSKMRAYEPMVRDVCAELVQSLRDREEFDVCGDYAADLPASVIGRLAGIPSALLPQIHTYASDSMAAIVNGDGERGAAATRCQQFESELSSVIDSRRASRESPEDLLSALIECDDETGNRLSNERILTHLTSDVLIAGSETTVLLIGNLMFQILSIGGLYQRIREDRDLVSLAVEESLRHIPPVQWVQRRATRDAQIAGTHIPAGSRIVLGLASANRDEATFGCPNNFDIDRGPEMRQHLAFNFGIHHCVGAPLARLEAVCALGAILDEFPHLELVVPEHYEDVANPMFNGTLSLPVATI